METMVHATLTWFLQYRTLIPKAMLGFRAKLSIIDCILDLTTDLEHNLKNTFAVFLDIE